MGDALQGGFDVRDRRNRRLEPGVPTDGRLRSWSTRRSTTSDVFERL